METAPAAFPRQLAQKKVTIKKSVVVEKPAKTVEVSSDVDDSDEDFSIAAKKT
uniref:Uncharacterized protein n=1 Tax=Kalanchoe fedtschenkoi TaxID=63787 RepID=A0A7N0TRB5_KALFE